MWMRAMRSHFSQFFFVFVFLEISWAVAFKTSAPIAVAGAPSNAENKSKVEEKGSEKKVRKSNFFAKTIAIFSSCKSKFVGGVKYKTLEEIAKLLAANVLLGAKKEQATLNKGPANVQFASGNDFIIYQQSKIFLAQKIIFSKGKLHISDDDYRHVLVPLLAINLIPGKKPPLKAIVIDPGHGGKDPGATNVRLGLSEKTLVLQMAQQLQVELVKKGYAVTLTRNGDTFIELRDRPLKAKNVDLFVSLHLNSATNHSAQGVEVFTLKRGKNFPGNACDPWNLIAGYSFLSALVPVTGFDNRGLKTAEFAVLKSLSVPGVLVEIGFMSNDGEAKKLADPPFQKKIVQGLVDGIEKYAANLSKKR
jgi:N-acetylmuramoyl-L-alanine amidase